MSKRNEKSSTMLTIRIDPILRDWVRWFAQHHNTTVTQLITGYFRELKDRYEKEGRDDDVSQI